MNLNYNEKNSLLMEGKDVPVISVAEMREADRRTIEGGVPSKELMRRAAQGVYDANERGWEGKRTLIICGSGNNGGDGYALAAIMKDQGNTTTDKKKTNCISSSFSCSTPSGIRTLDPLIKSQLLYQLSYASVWGTF